MSARLDRPCVLQCRAARLLMICIFVIFGAARTEAQDVRIAVSADSVTIGQRFYLSVTAYHDFLDEPVFPDPSSYDSLAFGDVEVLRRHARAGFLRDGVRVDSVVYEVTTFALDSARIAPIPITFRISEDTFTVRSHVAFLPVTSLVPEDADEIRDLAPLVEFPAPTWPYVASALALLLLAVLAFLFWHRRRDRTPEMVDAPAAPVIAPHLEALRRLRALEQVDLSDVEAIKPFFVEMTDALRHYLGRRLHVPALETTSGELIRELRARDDLPAKTVDLLGNVLSLADLVKFAHAEPPAVQSHDALRRSRAFVLEVEETFRERAARSVLVAEELGEAP